MLTTIVLGTVGYARGAVAYAGFSGSSTQTWSSKRIFGLKFMCSDEAYSTLEFSVIGCGPALPFPPGLPVQLVTSNDDGSSPVIRFTGDLQKPEKRDSEQGQAWGYLCTDLKRRADYVTLLSPSGLSTASYNLSPTDPLYLFSLAGQTVGQILTDVLQGSPVASVLSGYGIGQYTILSGVYTLPSQTATDLAALTIVPPVPVQLQGESVLNILESFLQTWQPQYTLYLQPDGTIRVISIFGRPSQTLTQPSYLGPADPIDQLSYGIDLEGCYAAVQIVGQDIAGTTLSYVDGTLTHSTAAPTSPPWTISDFNTPANANDQGTASSVTSNSCTVKSDQATTHWILNYWNINGGVIVLYNLAAAGIAITETRQITACTAMTAGGTATITWDSTLPLDSTSYTRYRMYALNTPRSLWDREFYVTEPGSGLTGLSTYIGSHMYPIFPFGYPWGNLGKGADQVSFVTYPTAKVQWSSTGAYPWFEEPVVVTLNPTKGTIVLAQPAVLLSAALAGQSQALANGYPTNYFTGLWYDVQVAVPYNRGDLGTRYPTSGYSGTANSKYGITRVKTIPLPGYIWQGFSASLNQLAQQILLTLQDAVVAGSVRLHYDDWTATFDPLTIGYAIQIATPGGVSDIDGLTLPVRSFTMEWPTIGSTDIHLLTFNFSNKHRQFEGDALYLHPMFAATGWGSQGDVFIGGVVNGLSGPTGMAEYNQAGTAPDYGDVVASGSNGEVGGLIDGPMGAAIEPFQSGHQKRADEKTRMDTQRKQWGAESAAKRAAEKQAIKDRDQEIYRQHREAEDPRIEPTGSSSTLADLAPKPPIEADKEFGPLSENFDAGGSP